MEEFMFDRIENITGEGGNAASQRVLLFFPCNVLEGFLLGVFNRFPNKPWYLRVRSTSLL